MTDEKFNDVKPKSNALKEKIPWLSQTDILWYLVFVGFGINYMIRINLNIAIVSMVRFRPKNQLVLTSECIESYNTSSFLNGSHHFSDDEEGERFDWDEHEQGYILGSFYWLHWVTQLPGGILARKYGTKKVFGFSNLLGVLCCFITPMASNMGANYLIFTRIVQGFLTGFSWPAMHDMTAKWIPPNERSKFVTAYLGSSIGAATMFPFCGYLISNWGWQVMFHICGLIGCVWYIGWYFLVFDTPATHPRISPAEKEYILSSLGKSVSKERKPTPWRSILTCTHVWLTAATQFGGLWGLYTSMTHAPTYFKVVHDLNIKATGFMSGLPHFIRVGYAFVFSQFGDYLLKQGKMSRTNVRKMATFSSCIAHGLCFIGIAYSGCNQFAAITFLTCAAGFHGAVSTGALASFVDLSPNYASILLGISGMLSAAPGFISPVIVGYFTFHNQTIGQWKSVFEIAATVLITPGILFILFGKCELQSWNDPQVQKEVILESEMKSLRGDNEEEKAEKIEENEILNKN